MDTGCHVSTTDDSLPYLTHLERTLKPLLWLTCVRISVQSSARPIRSEERILQYRRAAGPTGRIRLQRGGPIHRRFQAALSRRAAFPAPPAAGFGNFTAAAATFSRRGGNTGLGELKLLLLLGLKNGEKVKKNRKWNSQKSVDVPVKDYRQETSTNMKYYIDEQAWEAIL